MSILVLQKKHFSFQVLSEGITSIKHRMSRLKSLVMKSLDLVYATDKVAVAIESVAMTGDRAVHVMANYSKANLIDVRHICFNTSLEKAKSACIDLNVEVRLTPYKGPSLNCG